MRTRFLTLAIALGFLAIPLQGVLAAQGCAPCCDRTVDSPCGDSEQGPCAALQAGSCCDAAPASSAPPTQRSNGGASAQLLPARLVLEPPPISWWPGSAPAQPTHLPSPLRLSVVLIL